MGKRKSKFLVLREVEADRWGVLDGNGAENLTSTLDGKRWLAANGVAGDRYMVVSVGALVTVNEVVLKKRVLAAGGF